MAAAAAKICNIQKVEENLRTTHLHLSASEVIRIRIDVIWYSFEFCIEWHPIILLTNEFFILTLKNWNGWFLNFLQLREKILRYIRSSSYSIFLNYTPEILCWLIIFSLYDAEISARWSHHIMLVSLSFYKVTACWTVPGIICVSVTCFQEYLVQIRIHIIPEILDSQQLVKYGINGPSKLLQCRYISNEKWLHPVFAWTNSNTFVCMLTSIRIER